MDPVIAAQEVRVNDVMGGRGETRLGAVQRKMMEEYRKFVT